MAHLSTMVWRLLAFAEPSRRTQVSFFWSSICWKRSSCGTTTGGAEGRGEASWGSWPTDGPPNDGDALVTERKGAGAHGAGEIGDEDEPVARPSLHRFE